MSKAFKNITSDHETPEEPDVVMNNKQQTKKRKRTEDEQKDERNNFKKAILEENQVKIEFDYPFVMLIAGPTMSGKTYLTKKLLDKEFKDNFDEIYILSKTLRFNPQWDMYRKNKKFRFYPKPTVDLLTQILEDRQICQEKARIINARRVSQSSDSSSADVVARCPSLLLILDDILDSNVVNFGNVCDTIAADGRHCQISLIVMTQRISGVSRTIRLNTRYVCVFKMVSSEVFRFVKEYLAYKSTKEIERIMRRIFARPKAFLIAINSGSMVNKLSLGHSEANEFVSKKAVNVIF